MNKVTEELLVLEAASWRSLERILFRFAFCYIVLYHVSTVLEAVPGLGVFAGWYDGLWHRVDKAIGASLFRIDPALLVPHLTGSGDTTLAYVEQAIMLLTALIAGAPWTLLDRRRPHYVSLHGWLRVLARYALAFALCSYAWSKIIPNQFVQLSTRQLAETYGQSSPMALLWNFMGFSPAYTIFAGFAELVPAVFLIFRRTALLGAAMAFAVMLNVVMLNFCYDVPVKLLSLNLLLLSIFLILPKAQRLLNFFIFNRAIQPDDLTLPHLTKRGFRISAVVLKTAVLIIFLGQTIYSETTNYIHNTPLSPSPRMPLTTRGFHWVQEYPYNR